MRFDLIRFGSNFKNSSSHNIFFTIKFNEIETNQPKIEKKMEKSIPHRYNFFPFHLFTSEYSSAIKYEYMWLEYRTRNSYKWAHYCQKKTKKKKRESIYFSTLPLLTDLWYIHLKNFETTLTCITKRFVSSLIGVGSEQKVTWNLYHRNGSYLTMIQVILSTKFNTFDIIDVFNKNEQRRILPV